MKAIFATAVLASLVSLGAFVHLASSRGPGDAASPGPEAAAPGAQPEGGVVRIPDPVVQLGRVGLNGTVGGSFLVANESNQAITLGQITKSCGCTTAAFHEPVIGPGNRAEVRFEVRTGAQRGPRAESIGVMFTDSHGNAHGPLVAKVLFAPTGAIEVEPSELVLTRSERRATVTLRSDDEANLKKVLKVESLHPSVLVDSSRLPVIAVELADAKSESVLNTEFAIYTTIFGEEAIRVPVRIRK